VLAFGELLDHLAIEGGDVVRLAARDEPAIHGDLRVDDASAGVGEIGADRRPACRGASAQEVRFDELGGVSYTKGCYLGQETVARIHFRGHPNRELRGLEWEDSLPLIGRTIEGVGREVGTVRSTLIVGGRRLGIAPIRREVAIGETVIAGGRPARVVALPFGVPRVA
jgi:aminomethyltransferase